MKIRPVWLVVVAALGIGLGASVACGDETLTLQEYFRRLNLTFVDADRSIGELDARLQRDLAGAISSQDQLDLQRSRYAGFVLILGEAVDDLRNLDHPAEVEDAHDEYVQAFEGTLAVFGELALELADARSLAEADEILLDPELEERFAATAERTEAACARLQMIADQNVIDIDLGCLVPVETD